ncbi:MAG: DISARM system phospholipase D-like protein DrmC [Planctomycetes bacterium]|nr:DISARM system phospholipase D-like protein DrmC [Planctomycetota bacterium]
MKSALQRLSAPVIHGLVAALGAGRVPLPCHPMHLHDIVPEGDAGDVAAELNALVVPGNPVVMLSRLLAMVATERDEAQRNADVADLVWSGPEAPGSVNRDTAVVVRELFDQAERSVLVASYVVDAGETARAIFEPLAVRLDRGDALDVQLVVNIPRPHGDFRDAGTIVADWAARFRGSVWPGRVLPTVCYDPRALVTDGPTRACMHAKCVVVDERMALVTSANFTEAGHARNVEVGLRVVGVAAGRVAAELRALIAAGTLIRVPL